MQLRADVPDRFVWRWTADGSYSSSSAYQLFFAGRTPLAGAPEIWKASASPKVKFFCWLVLHGRPWTAERRHRHGLQACAACALCSQEDESIDHLLTSCVFTRQVWHQLLSRVGLAHLCPTTESRLFDWWLGVRAVAPEQFRRALDSCVLLVSWEIWKERNRRTFDNANLTPLQLYEVIRGEGDAWVAAGFRGLAALLAALSTPLERHPRLCSKIGFQLVYNLAAPPLQPVLCVSVLATLNPRHLAIGMNMAMCFVLSFFS